MYRFQRSPRATPYSSAGVPAAMALFASNIRTTLPETKEASKSDRTMREADAIAKVLNEAICGQNSEGEILESPTRRHSHGETGDTYILLRTNPCPMKWWLEKDR